MREQAKSGKSDNASQLECICKGEKTMSKKNELTPYEQAMVRTSIMGIGAGSTLENAINTHAGASSITTATDSDGKEYVTAKFALQAPTKKVSEIVVNDVNIATSIERMKKAFAMGEVAIFMVCKELDNFADTDAKSLGFDGTAELAQALFAKGKSTLANYKRIGRYFINDDYTIRGAIPQETSISLLNQLLSFVTTEMDDGSPDIRNVETLFKYGILTPYMKQKDYKRIISALPKVPVIVEGKQLHDLSADEIEQFKQALAEILNPKQEQEQENKEQEQEQEEFENKEQEQETPQIIIGRSMSMIRDLEEAFTKLGYTEEEQGYIVNALDMLYTKLGEKLGDSEQ